MRNTVILAFVLLLIPVQGFGQTVTSSVTGVIVDPSEATVHGAQCILTSSTTASAFVTQSSADGSFTFNSVPAGAYTLTVEAEGFQLLEVADVNIAISDVRSLGLLVLDVGTVTESVSVTASPAAVQLSSAEKSGTLTGDQIDRVAVKGRDFMALVATVPGVVDTVPDSRDASSLGAGRGIHINGGAQNSKSVMMDGHNILDIGNNTELQFQPNMDSIAEIKVLTSNYQAAFGRNSAGVISIITKSGSQEFHGTGYFFWRHEGLNANEFFRNRTGTAKTPYRYRIGGFSIGGPVSIPRAFNTQKDKLFFFLSQEWVRRREDYGTRFVNTPSQLERAGDFSQSFDVNGRLIPIRDPQTNSPFPDNLIPQNRIDPTGQAILNFFPTPNYSDPDPRQFYRRNYRSSHSGGHPRSDTNMRFDANPTSSLRLYYRFVWDTEEVSTPFGIWQANPTNYDLTPTEFSHPSKSHLVHATKIFSPTLIAEFSFNTNLTEYIYDRPVDRSLMGNPPRWFAPDSSVADRIPDVQFGGQPVNPIRVGLNNTPFYNYIQPYTFTSNLTKVWNSHNIQVGSYIERGNQFMGALFGNSGGVQNRGAYNFSRNVNNPWDTNHSFANALVGTFNSYTESNNRPTGDYLFWNVEFYAQDTWKVNRRFTLDLGLRFYHHPPQEDLERNMVDFSPRLYDPALAPALYAPTRDSSGRRAALNPLTGAEGPATLIGKFVPGSGDPANGTAIAGKNGYPKGMFTWPALVLAPRIGFAYDLFGKGTTAIRGGFGTYIDRASGNLVYGSGPPIVYVPTQFYGQLSELEGSSGVLSPTSINSRSNGEMNHPTTMSYSFGVQHRFWNTLADVSYVGSLVRHAIIQQDINPIPLYGRFDPANRDPASPTRPLQDNFFRPYSGWGTITAFETTGTTNYHALQVSANRRFTRGLQFGLSYTWSKIIGLVPLQSGGGSARVSPYFSHKDWNYGVLSYDRTHVLSLNYMYELPDVAAKLGMRPARWVLDDWEISGITTLTTGSPITPSFRTTDGEDITGSSEGPRITVLGDPVLPKSERTFERNFRTEMFARTPSRSFGNSGIGILRGPGISNWDISIGKRFPLRKEGRFLRFRAEFYNAWNHTQFSGIFSTARFNQAGDQVDRNFGAYSRARRPRIIQLSLKLIF